ncbi:MAG: Fic family protein [Solirubrobacterales bacterium]|nr:Fic family protein [Solirubrobacterales bacterium]
MLFGETRSKIDHIAGSLLNPEVAREMHIVYLTKGVLATTAIEGNTLSEEEARQRIEGDLDLPPSREYLGREIDNVIVAFNEIKDELVAGVAPPMGRATIENYNRMILRDLELDQGVVPGEIPPHVVGVGSYVGAPREDCEFLLDRLSEWLNGPDFTPRSPDWDLPMALVKAIVAHLYIAWIHPFGDGNGRTARLMELRILLEAGVPTPATHLLSNHYNQTRTEYYRQLREASRGDAGVLPFVRYALQGFVDGLGEQLSTVRTQQFADRWEQYVYQQFGRATTPARLRQRQLVLEMSEIDVPLSKAELRTLSPGLVEMYHGKTDKTLSRDINAVLKMGLVRRQAGGYVPNKRVIKAFLPVMAEASES